MEATLKLLTVSNTKTLKGEQHGYLTVILHLAPGNISGYEVCGGRDDCFDNCLYYAGRGRFTKVQQARIKKTKLFFENRELFMQLLVKDIQSALRKAQRLGLQLVVRLNGTQDIPWETIRVANAPNIFAIFPEVQFYDYTKLLGRKKIPSNYHLTFSRGSSNDAAVAKASKFMNIAVVFEQVPATYMGKPVINGDEHDLRFLDPANVIVGLTAKGDAKHDTSNFVLRSNDGQRRSGNHRATHDHAAHA